MLSSPTSPSTRILNLTMFMVLWSIGVSYAQVKIPVFSVAGTEQGRSMLTESMGIYLDTTGRLSIQDVLADSSSDFQSISAVDFKRGSYSIWYRFEIYNSSNRQVDRFVRVAPLMDTARVFVTLAGQIWREFPIGLSADLHEKDYYSYDNVFELRLAPGKTTTVYIQSGYSYRDEFNGDLAVYIQPEPRRLWFWALDRVAMQYFYLGEMLLLGVLSTFTYFLFRRAIFLSFAGLMVCFGAYFMLLQNVHTALVSSGVWVNTIIYLDLSIAGIVTSLSLFVSGYLRLSDQAPGLRVALFTLAGVILTTEILVHTLLGVSEQSQHLVNFLLMVWVIFNFYAILRLAVQGDTPARALTVAICLLFVGSLLWLFVLFGFVVRNVFTENAFQISTVLFAGIVFRELFVDFTELRRQKDNLVAADALKTHFFANISHEFRTPLTLMLGPLRQVIETNSNPADRELLQLAERNAERQLDLVDQVLALAQLDAEATRLQASPANFSFYIRDITTSFQSLAAQRSIKLICDVPDFEIIVYFEVMHMDRVFHNLLSNAFKFTPAGGQIVIKLSQNPTHVIVDVVDNGCGIPPELLSLVFDRYIHTEAIYTERTGSGIGLAVVREMVRLHHGTVSVRSEVEKGTTFTVSLPKGKAHLHSEQIAIVPSPAPSILSSASPSLSVSKHIPTGINAERQRVAISAGLSQSVSPPNQHESKPTVLLIEDNEEMRALIAQMLAPIYHVMLAQDGAEGIFAAITSPPDLIISDLMMPNKDGYEVCRTLKQDLRTSHIPLILLTARTSTAARVTGLDEGADHYLSKPFDHRELLARCSNLIRSRQILRERFASGITVKASELAVSSIDKEFLSAALLHVEAHLDDTRLSVEQLAEALGTSRTQLNLKMRALVNQSTNQFIQSVRLQRAAQLLQDRGINIQDVAYRCGFSSGSYFTKVFKSAYGTTPSRYAEEQQTTTEAIIDSAVK